MSSKSEAYVPALGLGLVGIALLQPVLRLIVAEGRTPPQGQAYGGTDDSGHAWRRELPVGLAWWPKRRLGDLQ